MTDPRAAASATERSALLASIAASVVTGAVALAWGLVSGARIVLLDGAYVLIGVGLAWFSLRVARAVDAGPTPRFPFGREALTPLAVVVQGLALGGTLAYAAAEAVLVILDGGAEVAAAAVAGYGAVTAVGGLAFAAWLNRRMHGSDLVRAEVVSWRAGSVLSLVMVIGAGIAVALERTTAADAVRFTDPVLVLVAVAVLAPTPVGMLRSGVLELLEGAPPAPVQEEVRAAVEEIRARFGLSEPLVRLNKVGRKLYVEVDFVVEPGQWDVADEDEVRRATLAALDHLGYDVWAYVELTTDPSLVDWPLRPSSDAE